MTFIIRKLLILYIKSFKPINSFNLISLFIIFISYILLFISFINKSNFLIKVKFINDIISLNVKVNKRVIWFNNLRIINVNLLIIKNFFNYSDYHLFIFKVIITIINKGKLINIKAIFNTGVKLSYISLNIVLKFEILITYNIKITL